MVNCLFKRSYVSQVAIGRGKKEAFLDLWPSLFALGLGAKCKMFAFLLTHSSHNRRSASLRGFGKQ